MTISIEEITADEDAKRKAYDEAFAHAVYMGKANAPVNVLIEAKDKADAMYDRWQNAVAERMAKGWV